MAKLEPPEPSLSATKFEQRCQTLAVDFGNEVGLQKGDLVFVSEISDVRAEMALAGRASEKIIRNRGKSHKVVPLARLNDEVFIWTGYRESWEKQGLEQSFRFVDAGFTLHIGRPGELSKPQIMRSEWVGRRSRAFVEKVGHPHWQLDVLESARASAQPSSTVRFGESADFQTSAEFSSANSIVASDLLLGLTVENMHFASAALWWRSNGAEIAHLPESVDELNRWILRSVNYLRQEAGRCTIIASAN